ncbi:MAG: hypothetical protein Q8T09_00200 [Candidatus Melainabacteria bacterium]|nr:hypothetical protein [Candidatus Melainabacteria bacterium]
MKVINGVKEKRAGEVREATSIKIDCLLAAQLPREETTYLGLGRCLD